MRASDPLPRVLQPLNGNMPVVLGAGDFRYRVEEEWGRLPRAFSLRDVAAVGVDSHDRVYLFNRGEHPMIVLDREGNFLQSWGEGVFRRPHGLHIADDDTIWCTDDGDHTVRQCTSSGRILLQLGVPGTPSPYVSGEPFHRCTHTALSPTGEIYVSDGYGNARIHKFSPSGKLLMSWGEPGTDPGQFNIPHNVCCDTDGWVYVADRENHRVQVFDGTGRYETQWNNMHRPSALCMHHVHSSLCYIGETGPHLKLNRNMPNVGPRVAIMTREGKLVTRLGAVRAGTAPGQFLSPHGLAVDSHGDIYVAEVSYTAWPSIFPDEPAPEKLRTVQKLVKVS